MRCRREKEVPLPQKIDKNAIRSLIPQAGAMCLLERVIACDSETIECGALSHREPGNPLRRDDALPVTAGIEYAAQAVALHGAIHNPAAKPRRGYLVTLSELRWQVERLDDVGPELVVRARRLSVSGAGASYTFSVSAQGRELLSGALVIALEGGGAGDR